MTAYARQTDGVEDRKLSRLKRTHSNARSVTPRQPAAVGVSNSRRLPFQSMRRRCGNAYVGVCFPGWHGKVGCREARSFP